MSSWPRVPPKYVFAGGCSPLPELLLSLLPIQFGDRILGMVVIYLKPSSKRHLETNDISLGELQEFLARRHPIPAEDSHPFDL